MHMFSVYSVALDAIIKKSERKPMFVLLSRLSYMYHKQLVVAAIIESINVSQNADAHTRTIG